jgi:hypothetical protein
MEMIRTSTLPRLESHSLIYDENLREGGKKRGRGGGSKVPYRGRTQMEDLVVQVVKHLAGFQGSGNVS